LTSFEARNLLHGDYKVIYNEIKIKGLLGRCWKWR